MSIRKAFATSPKLETEGVSLEIAGTRILIARAGGSNKLFVDAATALMKKHKRAFELDAMADEEGKRLTIELYAQHIVLNWFTNVAPEGSPEDWKEGIEADDGTLLPVTFDNIVATFNELEDLFIEVKNFAEDIKNYRRSLVAGIVGK